MITSLKSNAKYQRPHTTWAMRPDSNDPRWRIVTTWIWSTDRLVWSIVSGRRSYRETKRLSSVVGMAFNTDRSMISRYRPALFDAWTIFASRFSRRYKRLPTAPDSLVDWGHSKAISPWKAHSREVIVAAVRRTGGGVNVEPNENRISWYRWRPTDVRINGVGSSRVPRNLARHQWMPGVRRWVCSRAELDLQRYQSIDRRFLNVAAAHSRIEYDAKGFDWPRHQRTCFRDDTNRWGRMGLPRSWRRDRAFPSPSRCRVVCDTGWFWHGLGRTRSPLGTTQWELRIAT